MLALLLLFAQFTVPTHTGARAVAPAGCGSLPVSDNFAGSGALSTCWTQTTASSYVPMVRSSGFAVPNTASSQAMAIYTGVTFTNAQTSQGALVWHAGNYSAVCVNMSLAGTGICFFPNLNDIYNLVNGSGTGSIATGCTALPSGDTVKLVNNSSGMLSAIDVTTSTTLCSSSPGYTGLGGSPAIIVDTRTASGDTITNFVGTD
jgi:hypothetical protein